MTPILVFDIETIPDCDGLRRLHAGEEGWDGDDAAVAERAFAAQREKSGSDFLRHHVQRVCAISCVMRTDKSLRVRSLGDESSDEATLVAEFFDLIERSTPQLVSWNGGGFDLPVLHYRALVHGIQAPRYWDWGDDDREFKWNNYLSRYHTRHLDLMDVLAMFGGRANAPLDDLAKLCGFPGKLGMDGGKVWDSYLAGGLHGIRSYCETDVMNTWLVYCRFRLMRGEIGREAYDAEIALARETLGALAAKPGCEHWKEYLEAWK
ncbi:3'-5' exonuclease [Derxia gummosa]|uniref:3'-5' exonuclease n=1 Tax=Derxia gummosa DSM 723 TaxID=1121388 RepID=A0A8B6X6T6_9BURK|nr:3'-5' exonuclease [Derxia gummosa]